MESMKREDINKPLSLNDIETSTKAKLRESFELVFNVPLQQNVSLDFMKGNLAWILQAKQQKLNPIHLRKKLIKKTNGVMPKHKTLYQTGTRLVREWQGQNYEITIMDKDYHWQGKQYKSLTAIAYEITGTKWSGPRFFGLNDKEQKIK
jgi:hypothetical protein